MNYRFSDVITISDKTEHESLKKIIPTGQIIPSFKYGMLGGLITALLVVMIWLIIANSTGYSIPIMILVAGLAVGASIRISGAGYSAWYGLLAGFFTLATILAGLLMSSIAVVAYQQQRPLSEVIGWLKEHSIIDILYESAGPLKIFYSVIAILISNRLATK